MPAIVRRDASGQLAVCSARVHVPVIVRRGASGLLAVCSENVHVPATVRRDASEVGVKEFYLDECCFSIGKYSLLSISKEIPKWCAPIIAAKMLDKAIRDVNRQVSDACTPPLGG